jgi:elongation factor G
MPREDHLPAPLVEIAVEPKTRGDQEKLGRALSQLVAEDASFRVSTDQESGQTILKGMSELHLAGKIDELKRTYKLDVDVGQPQVAYLETITRAATVDYTHKKQTGGSGQFARVKIEVKPSGRGEGFRFEAKIVGDAVPKKYIPAVAKGVESVLTTGVLIGFPVVDVGVALIDGAYHDVDSSALAFEIASRAAFHEALTKAGPALLEPIMRLEVVTPEAYLGRVIGDINLRRGQIAATDTRGTALIVGAFVPLGNLFSYIRELRFLSLGNATCTMQFDHYARVPPSEYDDPDPRFPGAMAMRA